MHTDKPMATKPPAPSPKKPSRTGIAYGAVLVKKAKGTQPETKLVKSAAERKAAQLRNPSKSATPVKGLQGQRTSKGQIAAGPDDPKYTEITPLVIQAYLAALAIDGRPTTVAKELRVHYGSISALRREDPDFTAAFNLAMTQAFEFHEDEVRRRAFEGYLRPVYQQGMLVGHTREFSDRLAEMMIRAGKPELYNPKTIQVLEHSGQIGTRAGRMTDEELNDEINKKLRLLGSIPNTPQEIARNERDLHDAKVAKALEDPDRV